MISSAKYSRSWILEEFLLTESKDSDRPADEARLRFSYSAESPVALRLKMLSCPGGGSKKLFPPVFFFAFFFVGIFCFSI